MYTRALGGAALLPGSEVYAGVLSSPITPRRYFRKSAHHPDEIISLLDARNEESVPLRRIAAVPVDNGILLVAKRDDVGTSNAVSIKIVRPPEGYTGPLTMPTMERDTEYKYLATLNPTQEFGKGLCTNGTTYLDHGGDRGLLGSYSLTVGEGVLQESNKLTITSENTPKYWQRTINHYGIHGLVYDYWLQGIKIMRSVLPDER